MKKLLILLLFFVPTMALGQTACTPGSGVTCTQNYNLWLMPFNYPAGEWNVNLNTNFTDIDTAMGNFTELTPTTSQTIAQPAGSYFSFNYPVIYGTSPSLFFGPAAGAYDSALTRTSAGNFTLDTSTPGNAAANFKLNMLNAVQGIQINGAAGTSGQALCSDGTYFDTPCTVVGTAYYQTVNSNGTAQTQRPALNFSTDFALSDSASPAETTVSLTPSGATAGSYTDANVTINSKGIVTAISNGTLPAGSAQKLVITSGICTTTGAETFCSMSETWPLAFTSTAYAATCSYAARPTGTGSNPGLYGPYISAKTTTGFTLTIQAGSNSAGGNNTVAEIDCIGVE